MKRILPALALSLAFAAPALANGWPHIEGDADNQHTVYGNGTFDGFAAGPRGALNNETDTVLGGADVRVLGNSDGRLILEGRGPARSRPAVPVMNHKPGESSQG